jgi:hypothetical protein
MLRVLALRWPAFAGLEHARSMIPAIHVRREASFFLSCVASLHETAERSPMNLAEHRAMGIVKPIRPLARTVR